MTKGELKMKIILSFTLLFFIGCGTISYTVPVMKPAEVNLKKFKKIAVGEITGAGAENFAEELTLALFNCGNFEVLDRQNIDSLMRAHHFDVTEVFDEATVAKLGKVVGVAALVCGRVSLYKYDEKMVSYDTTDSKTGIVTRYYYYEGEAKVVANLRVMDLTTGKMLSVKNIAEDLTAQSPFSKGMPEKIDQDDLLAKARAAVINRFMKTIAPYQENIKVKFLVDKKMFELGKGVNLAKAGELKEASEIFKGVIKKYEGIHELKIDKAYYDLGNILILMHKYDEGIKELNNAVKINPKKKLYQDTVSWAKKRQQEYKKLLQQL